jgi:NAD(P)-dependent dehydrogenase (short-subunit alcohol dehydrogenase family)
MTLNILLTGANRGLGLAKAAQLLEQGHQILAVNRHQSPALRQLQEKYPAELHLFQADVTDETSIKQAVAAIANQVTHLDIVINNAAIHSDRADICVTQWETHPLVTNPEVCHDHNYFNNRTDQRQPTNPYSARICGQFGRLPTV